MCCMIWVFVDLKWHKGPFIITEKKNLCRRQQIPITDKTIGMRKLIYAWRSITGTLANSVDPDQTPQNEKK